MKKLIAIMTMMAGASALAVSSSNVFGILRVDSSQPETIISVPWIAADSVTSNIKVADLVLTSNLTAGDMLYYYNGTTSFEYEAWVLEETTIGGEATKVWSPVTTVSQAGITAGAHAGTRAVPRGAALFLVRQNYNNEPIYLYGRHTTAAATTTVLSGTSSTQRAYTLLAPAGTNGADLNGVGVMTGTPNEGDFIQIRPGVVLSYRNVNGKMMWGQDKGFDFTQMKQVFDTDSILTTIPHGQGCWYVSCGPTPSGKDALKFNW